MNARQAFHLGAAGPRQSMGPFREELPKPAESDNCSPNSLSAIRRLWKLSSQTEKRANNFACLYRDFLGITLCPKM